MPIIWGSIADWVSGIGSLSAALVALYLGRSSQRIRLKGYCGLRTVVGMGVQPRQIVLILVTNVGTRSTVVDNLGLSVGHFRKKRHGIITAVKDSYSVGIPFPLADSQSGQWGIPLDSRKSWLRELCQGFIVSDSEVDTLRFHVYTSHGETLTLKPEDNIRRALLEIRAEGAG